MSNIEWTGKTWNPITGCTMISPGCAHCYAETMSKRIKGMALADIAAGRNPGKKRAYINVIGDNGKWNGHIELVEEALTIPLKVKRPTTWFVNSMSDLFHDGVPFDYIDRVFAVMALCPQHVFQILTKRPERMAEYLATDAHARSQGAAIQAGWITPGPAFCYRAWPWPLPGVWLGTSVENQKAADERIPHLLKCPAAVRFLSCEPLLGPIDLNNVRHSDGEHVTDALRGETIYLPTTCEVAGGGVDWTIVGGESGHGARPCNVEWIRSIVAQCEAADVPVFCKQLGAKPIANYYDDEARQVVEGRGDEWPCPIGWNYRDGQPLLDCVVELPINDPKGGDMSEFPEDLRIRQIPSVGVKA